MRVSIRVLHHKFGKRFIRVYRVMGDDSVD